MYSIHWRVLNIQKWHQWYVHSYFNIRKQIHILKNFILYFLCTHDTWMKHTVHLYQNHASLMNIKLDMKLDIKFNSFLKVAVFQWCTWNKTYSQGLLFKCSCSFNIHTNCISVHYKNLLILSLGFNFYPNYVFLMLSTIFE